MIAMDFDNLLERRRMSMFSVCVFCGARPGMRPEYEIAAAELGHAIAKNGWRLVYGAGDVGLMGAVARACQAAHGQTFGVIPAHLMHREIGKTDLTHLVVTDTMHERKKLMFTNSDSVVLLPGGAGSLDEFFEVLTWAQLGLHEKPIVLINVEGYWDPLISLARHCVSEGFADNSLFDHFTMVYDVDAACAVLASSAGPLAR